MSLRFLRASRALWRRRVRYRKARLAQARAARDVTREHKWAQLLNKARERVKHRDQQIAEKTRVDGVSAAGVEFVARFEGFRDRVYLDAVGVPTIGYGETDRKVIAEFRNKAMSREYALDLLKRRLNGTYAAPVRALKIPLSQPQFDALTSLSYNLGPAILGPDHTIGQALRRRDMRAAADAFLLYDRAGGQRLEGLTRRRREERALFLKADR